MEVIAQNRFLQWFNDLTFSISSNIKRNAKFYRNRIVVLIAVCVLSAFSVSMFSGFAGYCELTTDANGKMTYTDINNETHEVNGLTSKIITWLRSIYGKEQIGTDDDGNPIYGSTLDTVSNLLDVEFSDTDSPSFKINGMTVSLPGMATIFDIFKTIGMFLVVIYFCIGLMEDFTINGQVYLEKMARKFIFMVVAMTISLNGMTVVFATANIGSALTQRVLEAANTPTSVDIENILNSIAQECQTADLYEDEIFVKKIGPMVSDIGTQISYLVSLLIPWAISMFCNIILQFICWSRFFEIIITAMLSPVGFADIARGNTMQSNGLRVFKNVIALSITGAVILLICYLSNAVSSQIIVTNVVNGNNVATACWENVLLYIVQTGCVKRSTEITKSALGMA